MRQNFLEKSDPDKALLYSEQPAWLLLWYFFSVNKKGIFPEGQQYTNCPI